nr:MAG TPA: Mucin binding domain [Caudoviricetes sp.]
MTRNLKEPINQTIHFTRTAKKDLVNGKVSYGNWTPEQGTWKKYEAPIIDGFIANPKEIPEQTVNADTKSTSVNIMYTAVSVGITINFIDRDNNNSVVGSVTLTGLVGENPDLTQTNNEVNELNSKGYDVSTPVLPEGTVFTNSLQTFTSAVTHQVIEGISEQNPEGVSDLGRDVTRTINFVTNN